MNIRKILPLHIVLTFCSVWACSQNMSTYKVILDSSKGKAMMRQCSRPSPADVTGFWQPTKEDLAALEKNTSKLCTLKAPVDPSKGCISTHLTEYAYQVVGIMKGGKKYMYVNALVLSTHVMANHKEIEQEYRNWQSSPIIVCDGGKNFWGVLYDVENKTFSDLQFNRGEE